MVEPAKRYSIEELLRNGVQPFDNLTPEQENELEEEIVAKGGNLRYMPVHLSAEGILYDGHQGCWPCCGSGAKPSARANSSATKG